MAEDMSGSEGSKKIAKSEFALVVHDHLNHYIQLADSKSSLLLSAQIAYLGLFGNLVRAWWMDSGPEFKIAVSFTALSIILAIAFAALAVYPRDPETDQGFIFWQSILRHTEEGYRTEIVEASGEELLAELLDENYMLAKVSDGKYRNIRRTMILTGIGLLLSFVSTAIYFIS